MKKKFLFLFMIISSLALAGNNGDSLNKKITQLRDSLTKLKDADKKAAVYNELYKYYCSLGDQYASSYKDSARLCKDSLVALLTRALKPKEEKKEEDTTRYNFRFKVYTDFVGFKGDQPNGLAQSELSFGWTIHNNTPWFFKYRSLESNNVERFKIRAKRKKVHHENGMIWAQDKDSLHAMRMHIHENTNCLTLFKNIVFPIVTLSKIKDSLRYKDVDVDPLTKVKHIHTFDLIKYSNFNISGKLNILTFQSRDKSIMAFGDLFGTLYSTGVSEKDTTIASGERKHNVNSVGYGVSLKLAFTPPQNHFSLEVSLANFSLLLLNNDIQQRKGNLYYPSYNLRNDTLHSENTVDAISIWHASIRYSTKTNKENRNNDGLFLRVGFYNNITAIIFGPHKVGTANYNNNFLQVQFGISKNMSDLLKFLKP